MIKVYFTFNILLKDRHSIKSHAVILGEISLDATNISLKIKTSIWMLCANHLWEVDHCDLMIVANHQVELIEITMN